MHNVLAQDITWNPKRKQATVEASSLFGSRQCPAYFNAYNRETNKAATFVKCPTDTERDRDNDVVFWVYRPTTDTLLRHPNLVNWKLIVLNE